MSVRGKTRRKRRDRWGNRLAIIGITMVVASLAVVVNVKSTSMKKKDQEYQIREEALIVVPQSVLLVLPSVYLGFLMLMFLLRFLSETMLRRLFTVMMVLAFAGLFAVSLLSFRDVEGGFLYFFRSFSAADMTLDYF